MAIVRFIWICILIAVSLIILVGCLWLLRVAIDWWLDIDYVKKIKEFTGRV